MQTLAHEKAVRSFGDNSSLTPDATWLGCRPFGIAEYKHVSDVEETERESLARHSWGAQNVPAMALPQDCIPIRREQASTIVVQFRTGNGLSLKDLGTQRASCSSCVVLDADILRVRVIEPVSGSGSSLPDLFSKTTGQ